MSQHSLGRTNAFEPHARKMRGGFSPTLPVNAASLFIHNRLQHDAVAVASSASPPLTVRRISNTFVSTHESRISLNACRHVDRQLALRLVRLCSQFAIQSRAEKAMAHLKIIAFPNVRAVKAPRFYWAALKTDPRVPEPAKVDHEHGNPVRVWFTGIETPFPADECMIYEEIVRAEPQ
jgi:hypothetical protein